MSFMSFYYVFLVSKDKGLNEITKKLYYEVLEKDMSKI